MFFRLLHREAHSGARAGLIQTAHGAIETPIFMPVATLGTLKGLHQRELVEDLDASIILGNSYHLHLRPGAALLEQAGGLHRFMGWSRPLLTDSGGYQVYSLSKSRKLNEEGVRFQSHIDGSCHFFTPESVIDLQRSIGADIIMAFDECTPFPCSYQYAKASAALTYRWLQRCLKRLGETEPLYGYPQYFFPIVQGSIYRDLREAATDQLTALDAPGYGIGGVCHPTGQLYEVAGWVCERLPAEKPRYLMGVGTPKDLVESIAVGVDMCDCVLPARNGRNGLLFTTQGVMNIRNARWRADFSPIDPGLSGYASNHYTKAYLHHLFRTGERLAGQIATLQNLSLYLWLVREVRKAILEDRFLPWKATWLPRLENRHQADGVPSIL